MSACAVAPAPSPRHSREAPFAPSSALARELFDAGLAALQAGRTALRLGRWELFSYLNDLADDLSDVAGEELRDVLTARMRGDGRT